MYADAGAHRRRRRAAVRAPAQRAVRVRRATNLLAIAALLADGRLRGGWC
jgi:hypothetical protein